MDGKKVLKSELVEGDVEMSAGEKEEKKALVTFIET